MRVAWILVAGVVGFGCGGKVEGGADSGAPEPPAEGGAAIEPAEGGRDPFALCPSEPPLSGTACSSPVTQGCAYTDFNGQACQAFVCDASGHWQPAVHAC